MREARPRNEASMWKGLRTLSFRKEFLSLYFQENAVLFVYSTKKEEAKEKMIVKGVSGRLDILPGGSSGMAHHTSKHSLH